MEIRTVDEEIRLIPYYPAPEVTLPWYEDAELCLQVDGDPTPYTPEKLHRMYEFLNANGFCYYIEYKGRPVGDVTLRHNGEICIVVCREYQNRGIGRRCVGHMLTLAGEKGMEQVRANIYAFNQQSRRMFLAAGFRQTGEEWYACGVD